MAGHISTGKRDQSTCTPQEVVDLLTNFWGETELDPCSNPNSIVPAKTKFMLPQDGLKEDWIKYDTIFVNPPFQADPVRKTKIYDWIKKCYDNAIDSPSTHTIALIPAAVEQPHFQNIILNSSLLHRASVRVSVCFKKGRIKFLNKQWQSPFPVALVYFGFNKFHFEDNFKEYGKVIHV